MKKLALAVVALGLVGGAAGCSKGSDLVEIQGRHITIKKTIQFETGKDNLLPESNDILDAVAELIKVTPKIAKVRIEGNTDNVGDETINADLSMRRAKSVKAYLVGKGVADTRLEYVGNGSKNPIADNGTDTGRAANRRVDFVVLD